jgi:hypothetical protein
MHIKAQNELLKAQGSKLREENEKLKSQIEYSGSKEINGTSRVRWLNSKIEDLRSKYTTCGLDNRVM